jgi:hypothetical protein
MRRVRSNLVLALSLTAACSAVSPSFAAPREPRCTCRASDGSKIELGQTACIRVGDVAYLARCEINLNVTTWRKLRDSCPEARLSTPSLASLH